MRHLTLADFSSSVSPYRLPVINNFVTPVPPRKRKDNVQSGTLRLRRLRPTTAPSDAPDMKVSVSAPLRLVHMEKMPVYAET